LCYRWWDCGREKIENEQNGVPSIACAPDGSILVCTTPKLGKGRKLLSFPPSGAGEGTVLIEKIENAHNGVPSIACAPDGSILVCTAPKLGKGWKLLSFGRDVIAGSSL
jgi:hypothetical protein